MFDGDISESDLAHRDDHHDEPQRPQARAPERDRKAEPREAPKEEAKPDEAKPDSKPEAKSDAKGDDKKDEAPKDTRPIWRRRPLLVAGLLVGVTVLAVAAYIYYDDASHFESTDDAFIAARQVAIAPKVTGYVQAVPVTDNEHVKAGETIAKLDDRDYRAALDQADAQVTASQASVDNAKAQHDVQEAQIASAKAQVDQAKAALAFAQQQASRYQDLAQKGAGSVQNAQQYSSQLQQSDASVKSSEAAEKVAERQLEALQAQLASAQANVEVSKAQREQAQLNEDYTLVTATEPGRIVSLTAEPGELAQPGTNLTMFVPDEIWVTANYKETQLDRMRPEQPVEVEIDSYPGKLWKGHVASVQPGSGTAFSLLPAQNATGNYVKVVQRVPVKIILDEIPPDVALGPGMSVVPTVRVDPTPSLWERAVGEAKKWRNR